MTDFQEHGRIPLKMRNFDRAYLLFEQSGTFKKVFQNLGLQAFDFDCENRFGETDVKVNLFAEIENAWVGEPSIFDVFDDTCVCFAFFPCTYFSDQSAMFSRADSKEMQKWTYYKKLCSTMVNMQARSLYYERLCQLCLLAIKRNFPLIVENPCGRPGFLAQYFPRQNVFEIMNRVTWGDYFKKPTQFIFVNCEADFKLYCSDFSLKKNPVRVEDTRGFARSRISPLFAENIIKYFFEV